MEHIHLIGVGGSAMAALAGMLAERGYRVTGSDVNVYPPASTLLASLNISYREGFSAENLKPHPDLVVVGNVIARGNADLEYVLDQQIPYKSMPEALKEFFIAGHHSIVIAGTHGKTTTTSLVAWIFEVAGRRPNFFVGGIAENFGKSYGLGGGAGFILEGDEYETAFFDRGPKFFHYRPNELALTSVEFDHADIYADFESMKLQFKRLVNLVPRSGRIVACVDEAAGDVRECIARAFCAVETYALGAEADWTAGDIENVASETHFRVAFKGAEVARIRTPLAGRHNILNSLAAIAIAHGRGIEREAIEEALLTYRSVRRRLEVKGEAGGVLVVDDFAHHPTAIRETIAATRSRWLDSARPGARLWAAVEPRSNTMRTKVFEDVLPDALAGADVVVFGAVHRSQQLKEEERFSPQRVVAALRKRGTAAEAFASVDEIVAHLGGAAKRGDVVLVMSNGSFDELCERLLERLRQREGTR
ncbi:MAG: UDP-N-acetylmuramate:L-alanyl-gamma-D-glutamyl-meso-diaminopimelate ligase [Candidatus Acidiferrales bacterium]